MRLNKLKLVLASAAIAFSFAAFGGVANAETIDEDTVTTYVGDSLNLTTSELKINGKSYKKVKSKIKTKITGKNSQYSKYRTKDYFDSEKAYSSSNDYQADNGSAAYKYYPKTSDYFLVFKKAGTYKISQVSYERDEYVSRYNDGKECIMKYNRVTGEYDPVTTYTYVPSRTSYYDDDYDEVYTSSSEKTYKAKDGKTYNKADSYYYAGANGVIYAYGDDGLTTAKVLKGADGEYYLKYSANKPKKVTYRTTYKVLANDGVVKSVKLGKATQSYNNKHKVGGYTTKITKGKFLTGNSGKLVITMADKNYKLGGVVVTTVDEKGNRIYAPTANKKTVTFSNNVYSQKYENDNKTYGNGSSDIYKSTTITVAYKNSIKGYGTEVSGTADNPVIKNYHVEKIKGKKYTYTETYKLTRTQIKYDDGSWDYKYTYVRSTSNPYYDSDSKTVKYDNYTSEEETSWSSLTSFMDYTRTYNFYKK